MSGDLFGDRELDRIRVRMPPEREWPGRPPLRRRRLAVATTIAVLLAVFVFPPVSGKLLVLGVVVLELARPWRPVQQAVRVAVLGVFFAFGAPLLLSPYPAGFRLLFYTGISATAVGLYEWVVPH